MTSFQINRTDFEARFREVRTLLSFIKSQESTDSPPSDSEEVKILRGLFFVHLYGAFEKTITEAIQSYVRALGALEILKAHTAMPFWPSAFDSNFKSLQSTQGKGSWPKRGEFVRSIESTEKCNLPDTLFSDQLQNTWPETLDTVLSYLGLGSFAWEGNDKFALTEVVDRRNQVAHGRTPPVRVGASSRSPDLEGRLEAIYGLTVRLIEKLETDFSGLRFIKQDFHSAYISKVS